jgi:SAM-dependent MidA family methyltransferase
LTTVGQLLRQEIARQGSISFARFMELALYCPDYGYYERPHPAIGRAGDYYTSASAGTLFGQLLAFQFARWLEELGLTPVQLVEAGAHDGRLAADILAWLGQNQPSLLRRLEYWIVEPSSRPRRWQEATLRNWVGQVHWADDVTALAGSGVHGVIFSNELLDAMPVHRLGWDADRQEWFEWGVTVREDRFEWTRLAPAPNTLLTELKRAGLELTTELLAALPDGFTIDISAAARRWWDRAASALRRGKLLTFDYGLKAAQVLLPEGAHGTLRAYSKHRATLDVLARPGEQDITAHVNFTQLQLAGETAGLRTEQFSSQERFLIGIAAQMWADESGARSWDASLARQFQTLTHPEHLGRAFSVLVQARC